MRGRSLLGTRAVSPPSLAGTLGSWNARPPACADLLHPYTPSTLRHHATLHSSSLPSVRVRVQPVTSSPSSWPAAELVWLSVAAHNTRMAHLLQYTRHHFFLLELLLSDAERGKRPPHIVQAHRRPCGMQRGTKSAAWCSSLPAPRTRATQQRLRQVETAAMPHAAHSHPNPQQPRTPPDPRPSPPSPTLPPTPAQLLLRTNRLLQPGVAVGGA